MRKIVTSTLSLFVLSCSTAFANNVDAANNWKLDLRCSVHVSNFNNIEKATVSKDVTLKHLKHQADGAVLVTQTDDYEFWVMTHSQQSINNQKFINNFQVAIKQKKTGLFMHALSDSSYSPAENPHKARISLVDYHPDSFMEKGELFFECVSK